MKSANRVLGICAMLLGAAIYLAGKGSPKMVFMDRSLPGPAFLPFLTAIGIALCGAALLIGSVLPASKTAGAEQKPVPEEYGKSDTIWIFKKEELKNFLIVIITSILIIIGAKFLGLLVCLGIGVTAMAKLLGTPGWRTVILLGIASTVVFYLVFDLFLNVPLPRGIFGI